MKRRRSLTKREQVETLTHYLQRNRMTQVQFVAWLDSRGILISAQYLNDVLGNRRSPGPKFRQVFKEITGIALVDGLVEDNHV